MANILQAIANNITELSFIALVFFIIIFTGYMIAKTEDKTLKQYIICVESSKQWINGNCINE